MLSVIRPSYHLLQRSRLTTGTQTARNLSRDSSEFFVFPIQKNDCSFGISIHFEVLFHLPQPETRVIVPSAMSEFGNATAWILLVNLSG